MTVIKIDTIDRSSIIEFGSVSKIDAINQQTDTLAFVIYYHSGQTFRPSSNSEVTMEIDSVKVFGGKIYSVTREKQANGSVKYSVKCKDYSYDLNRLMVNEGYEDTSVEDIIADIIDNYAPGFTYTNVNCPLNVEKIAFDRTPVSECLIRLSDITGYSYYIDYDKDIHFFEKNSEAAPFNLTDGDGNHITDSISIQDDFSQIRNRVFVKGGEIEGESRSEYFNGDGSQLFFKLSNKFSSRPTVTGLQ